MATSIGGASQRGPINKKSNPSVGGKPKAVLNMCMHLGGPMQRESNRLVCQWHGAEFDCQQGKALKGPARPDSRLISLPTRVEDGVLTYVYGE